MQLEDDTEQHFNKSRVHRTRHEGGEAAMRRREEEDIHIGFILTGNRRHGDDVVHVFMCNVRHTWIDDDALGGEGILRRESECTQKKRVQYT